MLLSRVQFSDPTDCSLPGSSIHGIFQVRVLEWVAISFSRDLPDPRIKSRSPALQADALPADPPWKPTEGKKFKIIKAIQVKPTVLGSEKLKALPLSTVTSIPILLFLFIRVLKGLASAIRQEKDKPIKGMQMRKE